MRPDNYSNPYDWGAYGVDPPIAAAPIPMAVNVAEAFEACTMLKAQPAVQALVDAGIVLLGVGLGWNLDDKISNSLGWSPEDLNPLAAAASGVLVANGVKGLVSGWMSDDLREGVTSLVMNGLLAVVPLYIGTADVEAIPSYQSKAMIAVGSAALGSMVLLKGVKVLEI
jgi:hypothetical protein